VVAFFLFLQLFITQFATNWQNHDNSNVRQNIRELKTTSAKNYSLGNFQEAFKNFDSLASIYKITGKTNWYLDYKNKSINCYDRFAPKPHSFDSIVSLLIEFESLSPHDTALSTSIIKNFIDNYADPRLYNSKLIRLDRLLKSNIEGITISTKRKLIRHRIEITTELGLLDELFKSYFYYLNLSPPPSEEIQISINLAKSFTEIKEFQLSNIILQGCLEKQSLSLADKAKITNLIGNNYILQGKFMLAKQYYDVSSDLREKSSDNLDLIRVILNNLGNYYSITNKPDSALIFYNKSLQISISKSGLLSRNAAFELNNIGNYYYNNCHYDSAAVYYRRSFEINSVLSDGNKVEIVHNLYNMGLTSDKQNHLEQAIHFMRLSFTRNYEYGKEINAFNKPLSISDLIISTSSLGDLYYKKFKQNGDPSSKDSTRFFLKLSVRINDSIIQSTPLESHKMDINLDNYKIIEKLLDSYLCKTPDQRIQFEDTTTVISLFDRCHNYVLLSQIRNGIHLNQSSTIKTLLDNSNIQQIFALEYLEENKVPDMEAIKLLSQEIFKNLKNKPIELLHSNFGHTPVITNLDLSMLFSNLSKHELLLEYTSINNMLYCLIACSDYLQIYPIGDTDQIANECRKLNSQLNQLEINEDDLLKLSNTLLSPITQLQKKFDKLIVIKDDIKMTIPFDILTLSKPQGSSHKNHPIITQFEIVNNYSISLWMHKPNNTDLKDYDFVGIAPFIGNSNKEKNYQLPDSFNEIEDISRLFENANQKTLKLVSDSATYNNFIRFSEMTKTLHIATHSTLTDNYLGFSLSHEKPSESETISYFDILSLKKCPSLVVLATCNSNSGEKKFGEGLVNLGRAFSIIGSPYIISSTTNLDDHFSSIFMKKFYNELINSGNISKSFNQTKLYFLENSEYSNYYFWGNLNLIGK
jgi:CHAT domain-containing protein